MALAGLACPCATCVDKRQEGWSLIERAMAARMIICEACGNKRCPHATDHRLACTNSNEPGQPGSRYGGFPADGDLPRQEQAEAVVNSTAKPSFDTTTESEEI